jgi:glycine cleavage system H protein
MNVPENLRYTEKHEWIRMEGKQAFVGITDYAQGELGDVVFVEIETLGANLKQGEAFGTIEAVKTVSDLFMPASGEVLEINPMLNDKPELVNKDPYGDGWMIKVDVTNMEDLENLLSPDEYKAMISA